LSLEMFMLRTVCHQWVWEVLFRRGEGWTKSYLRGVILTSSFSL